MEIMERRMGRKRRIFVEVAEKGILVDHPRKEEASSIWGGYSCREGEEETYLNSLNEGEIFTQNCSSFFCRQTDQNPASWILPHQIFVFPPIKVPSSQRCSHAINQFVLWWLWVHHLLCSLGPRGVAMDDGFFPLLPHPSIPIIPTPFCWA